jgi:hypothetical protein
VGWIHPLRRIFPSDADRNGPPKSSGPPNPIRCCPGSVSRAAGGSELAGRARAAAACPGRAAAPRLAAPAACGAADSTQGAWRVQWEITACAAGSTQRGQRRRLQLAVQPWPHGCSRQAQEDGSQTALARGRSRGGSRKGSVVVLPPRPPRDTPEMVSFVGRVSPRSGPRRCKGTQDFRQVRAAESVIPCVLCDLYCL